MDILEQAALFRARDAITVALSDNRDSTIEQRAAGFREIAFAILRAKSADIATEMLKRSTSPIVAKAAANSLLDSEWENGDAAALAASYVASIAPLSLLDQIKKYARNLPPRQRTAMIASGYSADVVAEGGPKAVRHLSLNLGEIEPKKVASIIVLTQDLARATEGTAVFEAELDAAALRGINASVLSVLTGIGATGISGQADPLADLRAGLLVAAPSSGYVVAMPSTSVAWLATHEANRGGMGVRGGTFAPGLEIVAVDDLAETIIVPASRCAVHDFGLRLRSSGNADVDLRDTPESPGELTSLFMTNSVGILAERAYNLTCGSDIVIVGGS